MLWRHTIILIIGTYCTWFGLKLLRGYLSKLIWNLDKGIPIGFYARKLEFKLLFSQFLWKIYSIWIPQMAVKTQCLKIRGDNTNMRIRIYHTYHDLGYNPDTKVHGANMGPIRVLSAPDGPHVGPMNLAIREMT